MTATPALTVIDMPVGLAATQSGSRGADRAARGFLAAHNTAGHRAVGSRVFTAPSRMALDLFAAGLGPSALNARLDGPRLSRQAFHICRRILDLDRWITPDRQASLREGHPECSFAALAGETLPPKRTPSGARQRRDLLQALGFALAGLADSLGPRAGRWAMDDLCDACILAWTASRLNAGTCLTLPEHPATDPHGLAMQIVV
jgi:predicted RNase H-like nuclease